VATTSILDACYWFDEQAADDAVLFFSRYLRFVEGEWAGKPFCLLPWQEAIVRELFGRKRADGRRRYRDCYIEIPRKNGKSSFGAGFALRLLFGDKEPGAQIFSAAAEREQARIVFGTAKRMIEASPQLSRLAEVFRDAIVVKKSGSVYKVLSAEAYSKHGLNAHAIIFDELHAVPTRELWDVLTTSTGARRQPLSIAITTAGYDRQSICWEQHCRAVEVLKGLRKDDALLPVVYAADDGDDWKLEATWRKANPSFGETIYQEYFQQKVQEAIASPAAENTFRNLHLCQWTQQSVKWVSVDRWDTCGVDLDIETLIGRECIAGLDLSSNGDIAALVLLFPGDSGPTVLPYFWLPEEALENADKVNRERYRQWEREGQIEFTRGDVIDYAVIRRRIHELGERYNIKMIAADKWNALHLATDLSGDGFDVQWYQQRMYAMSPPTKELERMIIDGRIKHGRHPVLRWMVENMALKRDSEQNVMPAKSKSQGKIDGVVALIMALGVLIAGGGKREESVYESRGVLAV